MMPRESSDLTSTSGRAILSLSWQSLAYGVGVFGSQFIIYLMLPILTRYMSKDDYGAVSLIMALYTLLNTLTNAGLPSGTFRFYNESPEEKNRRVTLGSTQLLFFLFAAVPGAVILLFAKPISSILLGSDQFALALQLAAGFLVLDTMNFFGTIILRIQVRPLISSLQSIILVSCETGMAVYFVVFRQMGVEGYWLGYLAGEVIGLLFTIWFVRKAIVFDVSVSRIMDLLKFGIPLIPTAISMTALRIADRYMIGSLAGLEQVAIYDVGYKLGSLINIVIAPFRTAWAPFAFSIADKEQARRIYRDILTYLMAGAAFLILAVVSFRHELVRLMAPGSYAAAASVVSWVAASQLFMAAYFVLSIGPMIIKRTDYLAWAAVTAGALNLVLNYVLIPSLGILGAAIATLASYVVLAGIAYFIARRTYAMQVDWNRLGKLAAASGIVVMILFLAEHMAASSWMVLALKAAGLLTFPIMLFLSGFMRRSQLREALELARKMGNRKLAGVREQRQADI